MRELGWIAIFVGMVGCKQEGGFATLHPVMSIAPESVDFGAAVAGEEVPTQDVEIQNVGQAVLDLDLTPPADSAFSFAGAPHLELDVDEATTVTLSFDPSAVQDYGSTLGIDSNDPDAKHLDLPLVGVGRVPYAPCIVLSDETLDWAKGSYQVGVESAQYFKITNGCDADLHLGSVTQSGAGVFAMDHDPSGQTIAPAQSVVVVVGLTAVQPDGDSGVIDLPSDDADHPDVTVTLIAGGGGTYEYPVAVIDDCAGGHRVLNLLGAVSTPVDGQHSTDPLGGALTYQWSIVRRPQAADANREIVPADQVAGTLLVDAAGTWEVDLVVTNDVGIRSAPTKCVIDSVPTDELHVELSWGGSTGDMDLHLSDGSAFYDKPGDVSWCNPSPDWGAQGNAADDGHLDLDDHDGYGPEQVGVTVPKDDTYLVRVHYFDDNDDGDTTATVSVFLNAVQVWSDSKVMSRNQVWEVGQINWPDATFGESDVPLRDAEARKCQD